MLSTDELTGMRATLAASLPDSCQVRRRTLTSDGAGGFAESWATAATVAARVAPASWRPAEALLAEREAGRSLWTLTLPALTDVRVTDRLLCGGRTFEVVAALARSDEVGRRVVAVEIV